MKDLSFFVVFLFLFLPFQVSSQWAFQGGPQVGYPIDFEQDGDRVYVCSSVGIFFTDNNADSWVPIPNNTPFTYPLRLIASEENLFVLNSTHTFDFGGMSDLWKSSNKGQTWQKIFVAIGMTKTAIVNDTIAVLSEDSLFISVNGGSNFDIRQKLPFQFYSFNIFWYHGALYNATENVLYRTSDLGASWQQVYSNFNAYTISYFVFRDRIWRAERANINSGVKVQWSGDGGQTWQFLPNGSGNQPYGYMFGNEDYHYIYSYENSRISRYDTNGSGGGSYTIPDNPWTNMEIFNGVIYTGKKGKGILVSKNFGDSYLLKNNGFRAVESLNMVAISEDTLYIMESSDKLSAPAPSTHCYNSFDGGYQWSNPLVPGITKVAISPDGFLIGISEGSFAYRSGDGGQTWENIPNSKFNSTFYVNFQDVRYGGDYFLLITATHGNWYSQDKGITWLQLPPFGGPYVYGMNYNQGVYLIVNSSPSGWQPFISTDFAQWTNIMYNLGTSNCFNEGIKWVYHHGGRVFAYACDKLQVLDLPGITWQTRWITPPNYPNPGWGSDHPRIEQMSAVGDRLFACVRGHGVFVSDDNGDNWTDFNDGLTNYFVTSVYPAGDFLFLSTDGGVWRRPLADFDLAQKHGVAFLDANGNGLMDSLESGLSNIVVRSTDNLVYGVSQTDGTILFYTPNTASGHFQAVLPVWAEATTVPLPVQTPDSALLFGIRFLPDIYDGGVDLNNLMVPRPGFPFNLIVTYKNAGTESSDFQVKLVIDNQVDLESTHPTPDAIINDTLFWNIESLSPHKSGNILIKQKIPSTIPIGTTISQTASITPLQQLDANISDNTSNLNLVTVGSYDPNDKTVQPDGALTPTMVADSQRLSYTIRFQNTGTYPASFVRIRDTISTNLSISSIEMIAASHLFTWRLLPERVVEFEFLNINLPDSASNEASSHGFVKFSIEVLSELMLTERIFNNADIYFDFNLPVRTNTVENMVSNLTSTFEQRMTNFSVYPVPATSHITIMAKNSLQNVDLASITDVYGRIIGEQQIQSFDNEFRLDIQHLSPGVYLLVFPTSNGKEVIRFIKI